MYKPRPFSANNRQETSNASPDVPSADEPLPLSRRGRPFNLDGQQQTRTQAMIDALMAQPVQQSPTLLSVPEEEEITHGQKLAHERVQEGGDESWRQDLPLLQEFRQLKGKNHEFLQVDRQSLETNAELLAPLANDKSKGIIADAATALRTLCQNIASIPAKNGDQKLWMRELISNLSTFSTALFYAGQILSQAHEYHTATIDKTGGRPQLKNELNEAKVSLARAWRGMQKAATRVGQESDFEWMLDFKAASRAPLAALEAICPTIIKSLKGESAQQAQDVEVEKARLEIESQVLLGVAKLTHDPAIREAASVLRYCCRLTEKALNQPSSNAETLKYIKKTIEALLATSESLQEAQGIIDASRQLRDIAAGKELINHAADRLEKQIKTLNKSINTLSARASSLQFDIEAGKQFTLAEKPLNDLSITIRMENETLQKVGDTLKEVKHTLRSAKTPPEVAVKKMEETFDYSRHQLSKTWFGLMNVTKLAGRTAEQGAHHLVHAGKQKINPSDNHDKLLFNGLLRASAHGPLSTLKALRLQTEQLGAVINKLAKADTARERNPQDGVLAKGHNNNLPGTTPAQRLIKKLEALEKPKAGLQTAQQRFIEEVALTETDLDMMRERYPQYTDELGQFRKQLLNCVVASQRATEKCERAIEQLNAVNAGQSPSERITLDNLLNSISKVEQAIDNSLTVLDQPHNLQAETRTIIETALQQGLTAVGKANTALNQTPSAIMKVKTALTKAEMVLYTPELMAADVTDTLQVHLELARGYLASAGRFADDWQSQSQGTITPQVTKRPTKKSIRLAQASVTNAIGKVTNAMGAMESSVTQITGKRIDIFSPDARIIKHLADLLAGQSAALEGKLSPQAWKIHQYSINESIREISAYFRKPGDAQGNTFALRLQKEYQRASANQIVMPQSAQGVMGQQQSWKEYLVNSGAKGLQSRLVHAAASQALEAVLNTALPGLSVATGVRALAKLAIMPLTLTIALSELDKTVMPGQALPLGAKSELIKNQLAIAATRAVQVFLPAIAKLAKDAVLTNVQVWRDGVDVVWDKTKESLPEDTILATSNLTFAQGVKEMGQALGTITENDMSPLSTENATESSLHNDELLSAHQTLTMSGEPPVTTRGETVKRSVVDTPVMAEKAHTVTKRALGDSRLYVQEPRAITIAESDRPAMSAYATHKYDRLRDMLNEKTPLSVQNQHTLQDIYDIAYPHDLDIIKQMRQSLEEIFKSRGENKLTPDSVVTYGVYHVRADGILVLREEKQGTLLELARGACFSPNEEIRIRNLPSTIQPLFHVTPYIGRNTFPITSELEQAVKEKLADFDRTEPTLFREKIWQGKVINTLCNLYKKENIPELKEAIEGTRQVSLVNYENPGFFSKDSIDIGGVFAIKKDNGSVILVSVLQQKTITIDLDYRYSDMQSKRLREFLLPHFNLNEHRRLSGSSFKHAFSTHIVLKKSHHQFQDPQNPERVTYRSPLHFIADSSISKLGERLADIENRDMKDNVDFLLTTEGEAWAKELIHQGKKLTNGAMLATSFIPSNLGVGVFNLGLTASSYGLTALEISQEDDASKKYEMKNGLIMDVIFSAPADIGDAATVLKKFKAMSALPNSTPPQMTLRDNDALDMLQKHSSPRQTDSGTELLPAGNARQLNMQGFDKAPAPSSPNIEQFEQYVKPENVNYRRPENKIGEGKLGSVFLINDHQVVKDYRPKKIPRTPNLNYDGAYQHAKSNADAFNRLYGDNAAVVYRYLENGQQKISVRMKQLDGESLYSLSLPKNKYSAKEVSQLFDDFKDESVNKLIEDTVNELASNKIVYNDFAQGNFIYSIDQKKLNVIDFDEAVIKPANEVVTETEKQQMRDGLKKLFTDFKGEVETNRLKMLQDDRDLNAARNQFDADVKQYHIKSDNDKYQRLSPRQKEAYDGFNLGYHRIEDHDRKSLKEIKQEVCNLLGSALEKKIKKLSEKDLIEFFNNPQKYKASLTWEQKGILSHYIQKLGAQNRVDEISQKLHDSAYQKIKGKGAKRLLHPQQLVITAAEVENKGRCLPMVLINEAGYASGRMKKLENTYQRIVDRVDVSQSKAFIQGVDKLHTQRIDPHIVSVLDDVNHADTVRPWKNIASMVDQVEQCRTTKSFLVTSDNHAMSIGVKFEEGKKTYHFQEPNIGWIEFKDAQSMKAYMQQTIGNKAQAEHFRAHFDDATPNDPLYRFAPIDTDKLKEVKVDGMGDWKVGDFSSGHPIVPIKTVVIDGNVHQAFSLDAVSDNLQSFMLTPQQSLLSIKRPDFLAKGYTQMNQDLKMDEFVKKLVRLNVKVFIDADITARISMSQAQQLKEALQANGITYISPQTSLLDCFMDGEYQYSDENEVQNNKALTQFNALLLKISQESAAHPQANILVCDSAGNGVSGLLKGALELKNQLEDQADDNFIQEISDKKPAAKVTTVIEDNFSASNAQDNVTYRAVQHAINMVRDTHPGAIERPSDVRLLNAYAEQLITTKQDAQGSTPAQQPQPVVTPEETNRADTSTPTVRTHWVEAGDTLTSISKKFYGNGNFENYMKIFNANKHKYGLTSPDNIPVNISLIIPD